MPINTSSASPESSPLITEIINLTLKGMTDLQIGQILGKHYKTVAYHRLKNGIASGRSHKAALTKARRNQTAHKRSYNMAGFSIIQDQMTSGKIQHGLNAYAPITCKGQSCPYRKTCDVSVSDLSVGEPCIIEAAIFENLTGQYHRELQIDEDDIAGSMRIRRLVEIEIKLMRCNRLMGVNPELVYTVEGADGRSSKRLNPIARYDLLLIREHDRVFNDLYR